MKVGDYEETVDIEGRLVSTVEEVKKAGTIFSSTTTIKDGNGNLVEVPGGFKIASDSGTTVQEGIVIEDSDITTYEDGTTSTGNQFVWIPVSNIDWGADTSKNRPIVLNNGDKVEITLGRYIFDRTDGTAEIQQTGANYASTVAIAVDDGYSIYDYKELSTFSESNQVERFNRNKCNGKRFSRICGKCEEKSWLLYRKIWGKL